MSDINEKIVAILNVIGDKYPADSSDIRHALQDIKQAFQEAGYLTPKQAQKIQVMVDMMAQNAQDMMKLPGTVRDIGAMTGNQWYNQFIQENPTFNGRKKAITIYDDAIEAAKRAAGIKEDA